jgi:hypothetical protein
MNRYKFDESDTTQENLPIIIQEGEYEGLVYRYGSIQFKEEDEQMKLIFDYDIIKNPTDQTNDELDEDEKFQNYLGDLLVEILDDEMGKGDDFLQENEIDD